MPLLMVDLDNTLIDRATAYHRWAEAFVAAHNGLPSDVDWLVEADGDGSVPRGQIAARVIEHFDLRHITSEGMVEELRRGMIEHIDLAPEVPDVLAAARGAGWRVVCVTNGAAHQQQRKVDATGLDEHLDAVVISEAVGVRKPDPKIFHLAAEAARLGLEGAWMVGDSVAADIAGGASVGARTAWLRRGRQWGLTGVTPTISADTLAGAVDHIVEARLLTC